MTIMHGATWLPSLGRHVILAAVRCLGPPGGAVTCVTVMTGALCADGLLTGPRGRAWQSTQKKLATARFVLTAALGRH
jgi:hypothetical protein